LSPLELLPILKQHRPFAILSSFALALLYAEEGWASYNFWQRRPLNEAAVLIALVTWIALMGYLVSFFLPPRLVADTWDHPRAWGVFSNVTVWSVGITVAINVVAYGLLLYLVDFDLTASYTLLRDVYVYTLFAMVLFHGMLLYVRYMQFLYQTPDHVQPIKVISVSAALGGLILLVGGFLFLLDLYHLENAPAAQKAMFGWHVYVRALYSLTLALGAYAWHLRWIADH